jgi:hypothetical protein
MNLSVYDCSLKDDGTYVSPFGVQIKSQKIQQLMNVISPKVIPLKKDGLKVISVEDSNKRVEMYGKLISAVLAQNKLADDLRKNGLVPFFNENGLVYWMDGGSKLYVRFNDDSNVTLYSLDNGHMSFKEKATQFAPISGDLVKKTFGNFFIANNGDEVLFPIASTVHGNNVKDISVYEFQDSKGKKVTYNLGDSAFIVFLEFEDGTTESTLVSSFINGISSSFKGCKVEGDGDDKKFAMGDLNLILTNNTVYDEIQGFLDYTSAQRATRNIGTGFGLIWKDDKLYLQYNMDGIWKSYEVKELERSVG